MIILLTIAGFLLFILCILLIFVFDDLVLDKHFTKKLRRKLKVNNE